MKVVKELLPAADPGKFDLKIDGPYTNEGATGDGGTTGFVNVAVGSHDGGRARGTGTDLADYESKIACSGELERPGSGRATPWRARRRAAGHLHDHEQAQAAGEGGQGARARGRSGQVRPAGRRDVTERRTPATTATTPASSTSPSARTTVGELAGTGTDLADYEPRSPARATRRLRQRHEPRVGALTSGEQTTCTITNKRKPQVKVVKELVPAADPGKFNLQVDARHQKTDAGDSDTTGFVNVAVGSNRRRRARRHRHRPGRLRVLDRLRGRLERLRRGTSLAVGALTAGQQATCTITNKRKPQVKVVKELVPAADPGKFDLQVNGVTKKTDAGDGDTTGFVNVAVGSDRRWASSPAPAPTWPTTSPRSPARRLEAPPAAGTSLAVGALTAGGAGHLHDHQQAQAAGEGGQGLVPAADPGKFDLQVDARHQEDGRRRRRHHRLRERRGRLQRRSASSPAPAPTWPTTSPRSPARATASAAGSGTGPSVGALTAGQRSPARSPTSASRR